jgi:hypothetical protein
LARSHTSRLSTIVFHVLLAVSPAAAAPFTPLFSALQAELTARVDTGTLDARQQRAAEKALGAMDAPSSSLATDVRTAGTVLKRLGKAFADEISTGTGLGALLDDLKTGLIADVMNELTTLESTASGLAEGTCHARVDAAVRRAGERVASADGVANPAAILTKALRTLTKGAAKAGHCEPSSSVTTTSTSVTSTTAAGGTTTTTVGETCGPEFLELSVDGAPFPIDPGFFYRGDDVQSVVVTGMTEIPSHSDLSLIAWGVTGLGPFAINEGSTWVEHGDTTFFAGSPYTVTGTLTVTKLVTGTTPACVAGSFDVTFTATSRVRHLTGSYELTNTVRARKAAG